LCIPWPESRKTAISSVAVPAYLIATLQIAAAIQDVFRSMPVRPAAASPPHGIVDRGAAEERALIRKYTGLMLRPERSTSIS